MPRSNIQLGGQELKLDADADTSITVDTDDQIDFRAGGTDVMALSTTGLTITNASNATQLTLTSTDADSNLGPILDLLRDGGSPADSDFIGQVRFQAKDDGGNIHEYAKIFGQIADVTGGTEDGILNIRTVLGGTDTRRIDLGVTETVFNEDSADLDFRVESDGDTHALFVDAGNNSMGLFTDTTNTVYHKVNVGLTGTVISGDTDGATITSDAIFKLVDDTNWGSTDATIFLTGGGEGGSVTGQISSAIGFARESNSHWGTQLKFYTHPPDTSDLDELKERMRINATGQVLIGTASSLYSSTQKDGLQIEGAGGGPYVIVCKNVDTSGGANQILFLDGSGDTCGEIASNATNNTTSYGTSSDYRLKENITDVTNAISTLKKLKPKTYNFISDPDNISEDGFLAHELGAVVPNAVTGEKDAMTSDNEIKPQQVDYGRLTPLLTAALQEAVAKIETLEAKITALEAK